MKKYLILIVLFLSCAMGAQEICNNGIDDDGDGLIDLNDPQCQCSTLTGVPSLIPNPSFESYVFCPNWFSQLDLAQNWIQATSATTDYYNCGFTFPGIAAANLTNYPDGTGIVGAFYLQTWKEYVGATLLNPMVAGTTYRLQFDIAALRMTGSGQPSSTPLNTLGPVNVTLFGCANGSNLPVSTNDSPDTADPTWFEIGHVAYTPVQQWGSVTIEFTPTFNVNAIMIGAPKILPATYPANANFDVGFPYILYDRLILNKLNYFDPIFIASSGDFCANDVVLHIQDIVPDFSYQWYINGIAIANATGTSLAIGTYVPGAFYSVRGDDGTYCVISNSIGLQTIQPDPPEVVSPLNYCQNTIHPALSATGNNLLWYANATEGTGNTAAPVVSASVPGTFHFYVSQTCGLESGRAEITVIVNPAIIPDFPPIDTICYGSDAPSLPATSPNGVPGSWTPQTIDNMQNGSYVFDPDPGACAVSQTLSITVLPPLNFGLNGQCDGRNYIVEAFNLDGGAFDASLNFQWYDANHLPIGYNQPSIDITKILSDLNESLPFELSLQISDGNGCQYVQSTAVDKIFCDIPRGISPNTDGLNESFDLTGLGVTRIEIFNRYGTKVYSKDDYTSQWNGQTDDGKELPSSAYYYYLTFKNEKPKTGWVYINR
jgi:gliding motility-associated-like protein